MKFSLVAQSTSSWWKVMFTGPTNDIIHIVLDFRMHLVYSCSAPCLAIVSNSSREFSVFTTSLTGTHGCPHFATGGQSHRCCCCFPSRSRRIWLRMSQRTRIVKIWGRRRLKIRTLILKSHVATTEKERANTSPNGAKSTNINKSPMSELIYIRLLSLTYLEGGASSLCASSPFTSPSKSSSTTRMLSKSIRTRALLIKLIWHIRKDARFWCWGTRKRDTFSPRWLQATQAAAQSYISGHPVRPATIMLVMQRARIHLKLRGITSDGMNPYPPPSSCNGKCQHTKTCPDLGTSLLLPHSAVEYRPRPIRDNSRNSKYHRYLAPWV